MSVPMSDDRKGHNRSSSSVGIGATGGAGVAGESEGGGEAALEGAGAFGATGFAAKAKREEFRSIGPASETAAEFGAETWFLVAV